MVTNSQIAFNPQGNTVGQVQEFLAEVDGAANYLSALGWE